MQQTPRRPQRPQQQAPEHTPHPTQTYRQQKRRRKARRRRQAGLVVMAVLVVVLFITALLLAGGKKPASSVVVSSQPASSVPAVSVAPPVSSVATLPPLPTRTPTPYDEEDAPFLFNYANPIPQSYLDSMELIDVGGGHRMEKRAGEAFKAMYVAAAQEGITLTQASGYRTNEHQTRNYNNSIQRYLNQGLSQEEAKARTEGYYAIPGTSEHEAGLAMDIGWIEDSFEKSEAFAWLQEHAVEYGFILRYAADTFDITRIHYEPWHYRYVGANHAEKIVELDVTLEEYTEWLSGMG